MARTRRKSKGTSKGNSVENAKRRAGRPLAGQELYKPELCAVVIELGKNGCSETEIAAYGCKVTRAAMKQWAKKYPEFDAALAIARDHSKAWWETTGRTRLRTMGFNTNLYNKIISCRFREDYSERMVVAGDEDAPLVHKIERVVVKAKRSRDAEREGS